jgi:membrane protein
MRIPRVVRTFAIAAWSWWQDDALRLSASLAYSTLFALAPVLLVAIAIAGAFFGADAVRGQIVGQIDRLVGHQGAETVQSMLASAWQHQGGTIATVIGAVTFLLASTGAFLELQTALNRIWRVEAKPGSAIKEYFVNRLRSFGIVVGIGFLLMVSLVVSAALAGLAGWMNANAAQSFPWQALNLLISLAVTTGLFSLIYRILPDVKLKWQDVWVGSLTTAILFTVGKELIGLYLGQSSTASSYGAAGSVIVLLLWVYYSSAIILLGAEFTREWTTRHRGKTPQPEEFAEKKPPAWPATTNRSAPV